MKQRTWGSALVEALRGRSPLGSGEAPPSARTLRWCVAGPWRKQAWYLPAVIVVASASACGQGSTGSGTVEAQVAFEGVETQGGAYEFRTPSGYAVELSEAMLWVGAVYANELVPVPGSQELPCVLPGIYVLESTEGVWVDALDARPQIMPNSARAIQEKGRMVELWLKSEGIDINAPDDPAAIATYRGRASRASQSWSFRGEVSIGHQRRTPDPDPTRPGANPICKERVVRGVPVEFTPAEGGHLTISINPATWFAGVDFADLDSATSNAGSNISGIKADEVLIEDDNTTQAGLAVFRGIRSAAAYHATWKPLRAN